jgi:hypothetical protein
MILSKYTRTIKLHVGLIMGLHAIILSYYFYTFYLLFSTILIATIIFKCIVAKCLLEEIAREQDMFIYEQDMYLYK